MREQPLSPDLRWGAAVARRIAAFWVLKMFGTTFAIVVFFAAYFTVLRHPVFGLSVVPLTAVDHWIGYRPETLPFYVSLWFYLSLVPGLLLHSRELISYAITAVALAGTGLVVFFFWPTAVPPLPQEWAGDSMVAALKRADAAGNACPSLHAAFAVFTACWLDRIARELRTRRWVRVANALWCAGILYSTMALRQHVFIDMLAGSALGGIAAFAHFRWLASPSSLTPADGESR